MILYSLIDLFVSSVNVFRANWWFPYPSGCYIVIDPIVNEIENFIRETWYHTRFVEEDLLIKLP